LEGAAITVLSKGVNFHGANPYDPTLLGAFPVGTTLLTANSCGTGTNPFPSSFQCNPSSIDGLGITNSSQGGGGIFVHGWGHHLQIANNRIYNNAGTLSGGINVGQGEFPPSYLAGSATNAPPGSCLNSGVSNLQLPYCHNLNVNVHHNAVTSNSSTGDELFSATPAGAGGVSFCTGADFYKFNFNWVCGNLSTGDGGGIGQIGFSYGGDIEHNSILFNQSTNPTIVTNGGGVVIMGAPDADPPCGVVVDTDCVPPLGSVGPSDGIGPGLIINANLIMGNQAESGSGGGLALQHINGSDVINFPNGGQNVTFPGISGSMSVWYSPLVTNNIIVNNVAGWDGAGISLLDALNVNIINNTVMSNDTTASAGVLFNTIGAPLASTQGSNCIQSGSTTASCPQPAGLVSIQNSAVLVANFPATITCPAGHFAGTTASNGTCRKVSYPELYNDVFWQNRSFYIGVGALGTGTLNQQNVVSLYNAFTTTPAPSQTATGACPSGSYWDIGVRGDTGPTNHASTVTLSPEASILTNITGYPGGGTGFRVNAAANPAVVSQYCNGSRVPPEFGGMGWQVPPGIADATVPNPLFNLTPVATVDEGNNWVNIAWGPLAETNPATNATLGNYALTAGSPAINYITPTTSSTTYAAAPGLDFFGNPRKGNSAVDVGAVEFAPGGGGATAILSVTGGPLNFGNVRDGTTSPAQTLTLHNTGTAGATGIALAFSSPRYSQPAVLGGTCGANLPAGATCTINVVFQPQTNSPGQVNATLTITANVAVSGSPVNLTGTGVVTGLLSFTSATNGTLSTLLGVRTLTFTIPTPRAAVTSVVTVTNTGDAPLAITGDTLTINIGSLYSITGTTCSFTTPLVAGGTCTVSVRYATPGTRPLLPDIGALSVMNNGGVPAGFLTPGALALVAQ
jgi:hypothetical protein